MYTRDSVVHRSSSLSDADGHLDTRRIFDEVTSKLLRNLRLNEECRRTIASAPSKLREATAIALFPSLSLLLAPAPSRRRCSIISDNPTNEVPRPSARTKCSGNVYCEKLFARRYRTSSLGKGVPIGTSARGSAPWSRKRWHRVSQWEKASLLLKNGLLPRLGLINSICQADRPGKKISSLGLAPLPNSNLIMGSEILAKAGLPYGLRVALRYSGPLGLERSNVPCAILEDMYIIRSAETTQHENDNSRR